MFSTTVDLLPEPSKPSYQWLQITTLPEAGFSVKWGIHLILSETFLVVTTKRMLACSEQRAEMLLSILQYTRQPPATKNYVAQNVNSAKVEKSWPRKIFSYPFRITVYALNFFHFVPL